MTYAEVMARVAEVEDVSVWEVEADGDEGAEMHLTVEDFAGFDEHWHEQFRDYDEDAVDALLEWLEEHALSVDGDYYTYYQFDGFLVQVGYASFDI
jgi:hypothetical protein